MAKEEAELPQQHAEAKKSEPNFHQISQERVALRRMQKEAPAGTADLFAEELKALNDRAKEFSAIRSAGFGKARQRLESDKEHYEKSAWLDEAAIASELGDSYSVLAETEEKLAEVGDFEMRQLRKETSDPSARTVNDRILPKIRERRAALQASIQGIEHSDPVTFRAHELIFYKKGLHREGHIALVPSVREYLNEIGARMIVGKPIFLHGPTGTGKTSLARYAAEHFTGQRSEMVYCNPQTRESNIWGKQGIRPAEGKAGQRGAIETVDIYGPLTKAMRGHTVIFDEFTALPQEQMVFVKGIFNAKPGDMVNVMGNGMVEIQPGFQMIFTANLKSEKNKERQELPPEIAREFEQNNLEINYTPKEEAYDIMLARLMNHDGSADLSEYDLNETLPKLCRAMEEIQTAYTDQTSHDTARLTQTLGPSNKAPGLKKLVLTQGTVENILEGWRTEKRITSNPQTFAEYVDRRLRTALTFKEYPAADRILAAKILASVGLLRTVTPRELDLPDNVFAFDAAKSQRKGELDELKQKSGEESRHTLKQLADLDPFGKRRQKAADIAEEFMPEGSAEPEVSAEAAKTELKDFLGGTYKLWYSNTDQATIDAAAERIPEFMRPNDIDWAAKKADTDISKFGEYTLNPETSGIDWESVPPEKIKIEKLPDELNGRSLAEVARYILDTYSSRYHLPGIEYWKYIIEHPDKAPDISKDGNYYFFFGSMLRYANGSWSVPFADWDGSRFRRGADWLGLGWHSGYRVVLLEK